MLRRFILRILLKDQINFTIYGHRCPSNLSADRKVPVILIELSYIVYYLDGDKKIKLSELNIKLNLIS